MLISRFDTADIEKHVGDYEAKNGFAFPAQYREFLLKFNGGNTPKTNFRMNKVSSDLEGFYGLGNARESLNYESFDSMDMIRDFLDDGMLPIGSNSYGDYITIGIGGDNNGKVYFLYHDRAKKYKELAEDFKTFVGNCKSKKIGHVYTIEERKATVLSHDPNCTIEQYEIDDWQEEIDMYSNMKQEELVF